MEAKTIPPGLGDDEGCAAALDTVIGSLIGLAEHWQTTHDPDLDVSLVVASMFLALNPDTTYLPIINDALTARSRRTLSPADGDLLLLAHQARWLADLARELDNEHDPDRSTQYFCRACGADLRYNGHHPDCENAPERSHYYEEG